MFALAGRRALRDQRGVGGYRDAAEALRKEARTGLRAATKYHLHFDLSNTEREVDLADVPFVLDDHKPLIHHFARDEHLDLKRYDVTDAERRARPPSPTPTQAQGQPATAAGRSRGPVSRESTATNLQLQLSPSKAKQSTTLTLRNCDRRAPPPQGAYPGRRVAERPPRELLRVQSQKEGAAQEDHHGPGRPQGVPPEAGRQTTGHHRGPAPGPARRGARGPAQLDAASAREEADFEAQMEARIIVLKEERERRMAEVRARTVTEVQEAFQGPWRDSAPQQRLSRTYERDTEMSRAERRMRGKFRPGALIRLHLRAMPVRALRSARRRCTTRSGSP